MSSSLEKLLAEDGFRGRKSMVTRTRTSLAAESPTVPPFPFPDRRKKDFMFRDRARAERASSDLSRYAAQAEPTRPRRSFDRREKSKMESWPKREVVRDKHEIVEENETYSSNGLVRENVLERDTRDQNELVRDKHGKAFEGNERVKETYSDEVYSSDASKEVSYLKDTRNKSQGNSSKKSQYIVGRRSFNECDRKEMKQQLGNHSKSNAFSAPEPAIDEVAIQAMVSILSGHVKRFLRDEDFRTAFRYSCLSSLDGLESKIATKLEEAIEAIERAVEESANTKELKRAVLQLSVIVGLKSNDRKDGLSLGIPNRKLSACAHLYLSVAYKLQEKDSIVAKHVLLVFCDSPFLARTKLLTELWDCLFFPNLSHLKVWYSQELDSLGDTIPEERSRKIELLNKAYDEIVDSGTYRFAVYYKDWLVEGVETEPIPSIHVPSVRIHEARSRSAFSLSRSSEASSCSPAETFSQQIQPVESYGQDLETSEENWNFVEEKVSSAEKQKDDHYHHYHEIFVEAMSSQESSKHTEMKHPSQQQQQQQQQQESEIDKGNPSSAELDGFYSKEISPSSKSIPQHFICPLTGRIFEEPVTLETGETFERKAIEALFNQGKTTCPVTSKPLEFKQVPVTNSVLKRVIQTWKSQLFDHNEFLSLGGLDFLLQRFKTDNLEERTRVASLLVHCIEADSSCRDRIAKEIDKKCLTELVHSKQVEARERAVLLLVELICLNRKKDVVGLLSELKSEDKEIENTMHVILVYLQNSQPSQKPLVAALLLHFDLLAEPRKHSIYREESVDAITEALCGDLTVNKIRENCLRALLILGGKISSSARNLTVGFMANQQCQLVYDDDDGDERGNEEWLRTLCVSLLGNGKKSFSKAVLKCLGCEDSGLTTACLTTVAWLSAALASMPDSDELQLETFTVLVSRLKELLENGDRIEHKVLASSSLLNFSQISECRVHLMSMSEDITSPLGKLSEATWTAKKL